MITGMYASVRSRHLAASVLVASIAAVIGGCFKTHHAASGALCGPTQVLPGWNGFSYVVERGVLDVRYSIGMQDPVSMSPQTAPSGESMYWTIFDGRVEAADHSQPQKFISDSNSMNYRPDRAQLEVNGRSVAPAAMSVSHVGDQSPYGIPAPDRRTAVSSEPIDLNHRPRPLLLLGFPVKLRHQTTGYSAPAASELATRTFRSLERSPASCRRGMSRRIFGRCSRR